MGIKDRQCKRDRKKGAGEPRRELNQHVSRLRAENVFCHPSTKCRSQAFALWPLHQYHQDHKQRHEHKKYQKQADQEIHRDGKYER